MTVEIDGNTYANSRTEGIYWRQDIHNYNTLFVRWREDPDFEFVAEWWVPNGHSLTIYGSSTDEVLGVVDRRTYSGIKEVWHQAYLIAKGHEKLPEGLF